MSKAQRTYLSIKDLISRYTSDHNPRFHLDLEHILWELDRGANGPRESAGGWKQAKFGHVETWTREI